MFGDLGRLHAAVSQLREVAERGSLGTDPGRSPKSTLAAALASDFHLIADTLSHDRQEPIADDIMVALGYGTTVPARSVQGDPAWLRARAQTLADRGNAFLTELGSDLR